jgi:hypothetical protein
VGIVVGIVGGARQRLFGTALFDGGATSIHRQRENITEAIGARRRLWRQCALFRRFQRLHRKCVNAIAPYRFVGFTTLPFRIDAIVSSRALIVYVVSLSKSLRQQRLQPTNNNEPFSATSF